MTVRSDAFPTADSDPDPESDSWSLSEKESGPRVKEADGFEYWAQYIEYRRDHKWDTVVAMTGEEGSGKSTLGRRLAYRLNPHWKASENLCYSAVSVLDSYERIRAGLPRTRGTVIDYDEGQRGLMAGEQMTAEQRALVKGLMLVRSVGAILIICAPDIWRIANAIRGRRATLWFHVERRGRALVHERDYRLRYKQDSRTLRMTVSPTAPYLTWKPFRDTDPRQIEYEAKKDQSMGEFLREARDELRHRAAQSDPKARSRKKNAERQARWRENRKKEREEMGGQE